MEKLRHENQCWNHLKTLQMIKGRVEPRALSSEHPILTRAVRGFPRAASRRWCGTAQARCAHGQNAPALSSHRATAALHPGCSRPAPSKLILSTKCPDPGLKPSNVQTAFLPKLSVKIYPPAAHFWKSARAKTDLPRMKNSNESDR